ncbi:uncharacterized protein BT62DRAFT_934144 [Guyanagaster necrorhizus]|uniref:Uncharacterized protein n=1 Tax=Guyanagaster necrorhizus TaxID=856835 RepID=A0A9P7VNK6_9AGAR|nr:uncharacterized protein BT62DRAFT_934144 [Guyanagaster necrorhizus MCA 3950]KAG7444496.1 hypothetical protein BT62DRAFT_934144 [Guyanagaster necrorhizus MCA 3950]
MVRSRHGISFTWAANFSIVRVDKNPSSVDRSLPDAPIEPPDENTDVVMLDDEDEDANTRFVNFKANLNTDEEDEDDIDSRFIPSDADTQYHHGSITEILSTSTGFQNGSLA